jgi:uncharacterized ferritin-like protein (DUF455 family)
VAPWQATRRRGSANGANLIVRRPYTQSRPDVKDSANPKGEATTVEDFTVEEWALAYVEADRWEAKLDPRPAPATFAAAGRAPPPPARAGRGPEFVVRAHADKSSGRSLLRSPERRARLMHTFLHHELQAAELMAWALLAFPDAPRKLKRGLVGILFDEVRHMNLYARYLASRGYRPGSFPVRDWFWERVPSCRTLDAFLATMGMGFEGANLDHSTRFAARFRDAGDEEAARIQEQVAREEVPHVRFALRWFEKTSPRVARGAPTFEAWRASLPEPLSPWVMHGRPVARALRARAGFAPTFVDALERAGPCAPGS